MADRQAEFVRLLSQYSSRIFGFLLALCANRADAEQLKAQVAAKVGVAGMVRPHP